MNPEDLIKLKQVKDALEQTAKDMFRERITVRTNENFSLLYEVKAIDAFLQPHVKVGEMRAWCQQQWLAPWDIDNKNGTWCYDGHGVFNFKHDKDRTTFLLRWS
jgi:hypothetical protein